jgi:uncharacterized protein (TIGR03089 family)
VSSNRFLSADVPALMLDLISMDPGRPRVTWYGPDHERVEFSAKTLNNWVSKTANLLVDELDAGPGTRLGIALPGHWRTVVWLLSAWSVGAHPIVLPSAAPQDGAPTNQVDVLVTDRPSSPPPDTVESLLVVVALPALATRFLGDVPPGAIDAAAEVRLQPDVFVAGDRPDGSDPAFTSGGRTVTYADLMTTARAGNGTDVQNRAPGFPAEPPDTRTGAIRLLTGAGPDRAIETYLAALAAGGSIVLHHDLAGLTDAERAHLAGQEGVTAIDL